MVTPNSEDTWADVIDPSVRRLVQNRLNQRASRQRKLHKEESMGVIRRPRGRPKIITTTTTETAADEHSNTATPATSSKALQAPQSCLSDSSFVQTVISTSAPTVTITPNIYDAKAIVSKLIENLSLIILRRLSCGDPSSDLLVHVTTLNSLRAIVYIMGMLDIAVNEMDDDNSISTFNSHNPTTIARWHLLPESLQPTVSQLAVAHHPWIDALPFPSLRDNLIIHEDTLAANEEDMSDAKLCSDTLGLEAHTSAGLLVWGDPWNAFSWEMSDEFVKKWGWILGGCDELVRSTNYWRARRGELGLVV